MVRVHRIGLSALAALRNPGREADQRVGLVLGAHVEGQIDDELAAVRTGAPALLPCLHGHAGVVPVVVGDQVSSAKNPVIK